MQVSSRVCSWTVACAAAAAGLSNAAHLLYWGTELRTVGPRSLPLLVVTSVSLLAAVALALVHYRQVRDVTERRRLRVVVAGIVVAALPGYWAIVSRWLPDRTNQSQIGLCVAHHGRHCRRTARGAAVPDIRGAPAPPVRRRLYRQDGPAVTLARSTVLSLVPAISLFMILETLRLRNLTVNAVLARRGALFLLLTLIAFVVFAYRRRWLRAIDRRFFRERHYAYSVLREVAVEVGRAGTWPALRRSSSPESKPPCTRNSWRCWSAICPRAPSGPRRRRLPAARRPIFQRTASSWRWLVHSHPARCIRRQRRSRPA